LVDNLRSFFGILSELILPLRSFKCLMYFLNCYISGIPHEMRFCCYQSYCHKINVVLASVLYLLIRWAVKNFPQWWYSTLMVRHTAMLT
jgi:hypothetical protein